MKNRWVHPSLYSVFMRIRLNKQNYCIAAYRFYVNNFSKLCFFCLIYLESFSIQESVNTIISDDV